MKFLKTKIMTALALALSLTACDSAEQSEDTTRVTQENTSTTYEVENKAPDMRVDGANLSVENETNLDDADTAPMTVTQETTQHDDAHRDATMNQKTDMVATQDKTIAVITSEDPQFSTLNDLIEKAGLSQTLNGGEYTVFAPTNQAFASVPQATLDKLSQDPQLLKDVLMFHVVQNKIPADTVVTLTQAQPLRQGEAIVIETQGEGAVVLNDQARVIRTDLMAKNGVVHVIDSVLLPQGVM